MSSELIEEAVSLLNRSEYSEALKCFRKYHNIVNGWICSDCQVITKHTSNFICQYCGGTPEAITFQEKSDEAK